MALYYTYESENEQFLWNSFPLSLPPPSLSHTHTHTHTHMQDLILWLWALWLHKAETQHKLFSTSKNSSVHVNRMSKNRFTGMDGPRVSSKKTSIRVQSQFLCPFLYSCTGICLHGGRMASSTFGLTPSWLSVTIRKIISFWRVPMKVLDCATLDWFGSGTHLGTNHCG